MFVFLIFCKLIAESRDVIWVQFLGLVVCSSISFIFFCVVFFNVYLDMSHAIIFILLRRKFSVFWYIHELVHSPLSRFKMFPLTKLSKGAQMLSRNERAAVEEEAMQIWARAEMLGNSRKGIEGPATRGLLFPSAPHAGHSASSLHNKSMGFLRQLRKKRCNVCELLSNNPLGGRDGWEYEWNEDWPFF